MCAIATEPCAACGEETGIGTVFYSDRRLITRADGNTAYLCVLCDARAAAARKGRRLSDEELGRTIETDGFAQLARWEQLDGDLPGGGRI